MTQGPSVLLFGYGNPGRLDDGLGPRLADLVAARELPGVACESAYQLSVEDAADVARHDLVIFADATVGGTDTYLFRRLLPRSAESFSTHSVRPEALLGLARDIFGWSGKAYVLGIRGYDFNEYEERLSEDARANLDAAAAFVHQMLTAAGSEDLDDFTTGSAVSDSVTLCNGGV